jgi:hypothetical protein
MALNEKEDFLWDLVRGSRCADDKDGQGDKEGRLAWQLKGMRVCRRAFKTCLGIGNKKIRKLCEALQLGMQKPFADQRWHNGSHQVATKYMDVDSFFNFMYHYVAEPLADDDDHAPEIVVETHWQAKLVQWMTAKDSASAGATSSMVSLIDGVGERR